MLTYLWKSLFLFVFLVKQPLSVLKMLLTWHLAFFLRRCFSFTFLHISCTSQQSWHGHSSCSVKNQATSAQPCMEYNNTLTGREDLPWGGVGCGPSSVRRFHVRLSRTTGLHVQYIYVFQSQVGVHHHWFPASLRVMIDIEGPLR
jgi:hypothetical protein